MLNIKKLNKAILYVKNKDFESAEKIYSELLRECPNDDTVLSFWGLFNIKKGLFTKAEKILETAYNIKKAPSTIAGLAYTKFQLKKYDDAIILYEELFRYDKDSEHIYQKIIECFRALNMYNFANAYCQKYLNAYPNNRHALSLITQNYMNLGEYKKAEEYCARTMQLYPDNSATWISAGLLQELFYNNEEVAQECYKKAIENGDNQAYYHLAVSLQKTGNKKEAEICYKKALEYYPEDKAIKGSLGMMYLSDRKFKEGYEYYCQREESKEIKSLKNRKIQECSGEVILVYSDQGLGDGIQYSRYLPLLKEKFKQVFVYVRKPLKNLLSRSFPEVIFVDKYDDLDYDCSVLIADLPYFLGADFDNIPNSDDYLRPNQEKTEYFKQKYFQTNKYRIGLCWKAGDMGIRSAINRTINIDYLKPLLELENVEFYSFQKDDIFNGCEKYPQIIDLSNEFSSLDDTAAAMKNLDLMLSVDTACIHLAGALGIKSLLFIPYCSDWRWFNNTQNTEWYSSVKILKQNDRQDWFKEVDKCKQFLIKMTE